MNPTISFIPLRDGNSKKLPHNIPNPRKVAKLIFPGVYPFFDFCLLSPKNGKKSAASF
jgi:hypothetical protein